VCGVVLVWRGCSGLVMLGQGWQPAAAQGPACLSVLDRHDSPRLTSTRKRPPHPPHPPRALRPQELLLSKLLRSATLAGRKSQEVVAEYLASYQSMIPPLPAAEQGMKRNGGLGGDPLAAAEAGQGLAEAMSMRWGASAAAAAVAAAGGEQGEAAANGEAAAQFRASEQRHLQKIRSTKGEKEVVLPLERAQAIIRWGVGGVWLRGSARGR
jgi:hypothetical protein